MFAPENILWTPAERADHARTTFKHLDTNQDGALGVAELGAGLSDGGMTDEAIEKLFFILDTDQDGVVTEDEYVKGYEAICQRVRWEERRQMLINRGSSVPRARTSTIEQTAARAITMAQLQDFELLARWVFNSFELKDESDYSATKGNRIVFDDTEQEAAVEANMYHINSHIILPLTAGEFLCSWVEMVASAPQPPTWFVSHAWGTIFNQTIKMLRWHHECKQLPADSPYWVCTFANNQHNLDELNTASLDQTPFWRALALETCVGMVQVMDDNCTPHTRIWCILEIHVLIMLEKPFEVLAMIQKDTQTYSDEDVPAGPALRDGDGVEHIQSEHGFFPESVALKGVRVRVQDAKASQSKDRENILRVIVGAQGMLPKEHPKYEAVNDTVQSQFRGAALYNHAIDGNCEAIRELVAQSPEDVNYQGPDGESLLYMAAGHNHLDLVKLLAKLGANVNQADDDGATPVYMAARENHLDMVRLLNELGADLDQATNMGETPIYKAAENSHAEVVQLLGELGADLNRATNTGLTPLGIAASEGYNGTVEALLKVKADLCTLCLGKTPLDWAQASHHSIIVELLLAAGASVSLVSP